MASKSEVTATERARFRSGVSAKLMELYEEAVELDECSDNMVGLLTDAMRLDPRRAREVFGFVRLTPRPTEEQLAALNGVTDALSALREACVELVASYLTPEEKRHLGVDTNLFQTRAERSSTYQYSASPKQPWKPQKRTGTDKAASQDRTTVDESSTTEAASPSSVDGRNGEKDHERRREGSGEERSAAPPATMGRASRQRDSQGATAGSVKGSQTHRGSVAAGSRSSLNKSGRALPPSSVSQPRHQPAASLQDSARATSLGGPSHADPQPAVEEIERGGGEGRTAGVDASDTAEERLSASPRAVHRHSESGSDGDVAVGTPERQWAAPGNNESLSSLGGGGGAGTPTSGPSPIRLEAPPPSSPSDVKTPAAPAGDEAVATGLNAAPTERFPKKAPISNEPTPAPSRASVSKASVQQTTAPFLSPPPPSSQPPSKAASSTAVPPTTRPEFRRFMIETDSDSLV